MKMKHRSEHPSFDKHGSCTRCGLGIRFGKRCPPGFWMTKAEGKAWDAFSPAERTAMEARLCADDTKGRA